MTARDETGVSPHPDWRPTPLRQPYEIEGVGLLRVIGSAPARRIARERRAETLWMSVVITVVLLLGTIKVVWF